jgi:hypothetical protein
MAAQRSRRMSNLVSEMIRDYKRSLLARRYANASASSPIIVAQPKKSLPPWPKPKPYKPAPDYHLRTSHL